MKNNLNRRANPGKGSGILWGLFAGLAIGLAIAFGVVWYLNKTPLPFRDGLTTAVPAAVVPGSVPAPLPGKPGDKPREKTQLDFYTMLPGNAASPPAAVTPPDSTIPTPAEVKPAEVFFLQVGAFQKMQDVDKLKAKLALMGMEASVQEANIADKGVMQRVRVGPFRSPEEMNRARTTLAQGGVQTTVIKQKEPPAQ